MMRGLDQVISRGLPSMTFSFYYPNSVFRLDVAHGLWSYHREPSKSNDMTLGVGNRCRPVMFQ